MTLVEFAEKNRLRLRRGEDGELEIAGRAGAVYEYGSGVLAVMVLERSRRRWNLRRKEMAAAGMRVRQDGDTEGSLTFDPTDALQVGYVVKYARIKRRHTLSAARLAVLERARTLSPLKLGLRCQDPSEP